MGLRDQMAGVAASGQAVEICHRLTTGGGQPGDIVAWLNTIANAAAGDWAGIAWQTDAIHEALTGGVSLPPAPEWVTHVDDLLAWPWTRTRDVAWLANSGRFRAARRVLDSPDDIGTYLAELEQNRGVDDTLELVREHAHDTRTVVRLTARHYLRDQAFAALDTLANAGDLLYELADVDPDLARHAAVWFANHLEPHGARLAASAWPASEHQPAIDAARAWVTGPDDEHRAARTRVCDELWATFAGSLAELRDTVHKIAAA